MEMFTKNDMQERFNHQMAIWHTRNCVLLFTRWREVWTKAIYLMIKPFNSQKSCLSFCLVWHPWCQAQDPSRLHVEPTVYFCLSPWSTARVLRQMTSFSWHPNVEEASNSNIHLNAQLEAKTFLEIELYNIIYLYYIRCDNLEFKDLFSRERLG